MISFMPLVWNFGINGAIQTEHMESCISNTLRGSCRHSCSSDLYREKNDSLLLKRNSLGFIIFQEENHYHKMYINVFSIINTVFLPQHLENKII